MNEERPEERYKNSGNRKEDTIYVQFEGKIEEIVVVNLIKERRCWSEVWEVHP